MKTYTFYVSGIHCKACVLTIESDLGELSYIENVKVNLKTNIVEATGDFVSQNQVEVMAELNKILIKKGYELSIEKKEKINKWSDFKIAMPIALGLILVFVGLQKLGIINLISVGKVTYGTAFVVGVVASLSTCMAVVGGILLSMSATFAKGGDTLRPQTLFHIGRLVSFFVLGGLLGALGPLFPFNTNGTFVISLIIGLVMLILGINLLDVFHFTKKLQIYMPEFLSKRALSISKLNHSLTPLLIGIATFFLPCGFTQSMQIYALSVGSFWGGGLTMFSFALGTLPVLAIISFSSISVKNISRSGVFFKTAGLVVIMFALLNIINSLVVAGIISPVFNF